MATKQQLIDEIIELGTDVKIYKLKEMRVTELVEMRDAMLKPAKSRKGWTRWTPEKLYNAKGERFCRCGCETFYPVEEFSKYSGGIDGLNSWSRSCLRAYRARKAAEKANG